MQSTVTSFPGDGRDDASASDDSAARTMTIYLDPPIDGSNGRTYTELLLEEPTAKMVERAEAELGGNMSVHALRKYQIALVSQGSKTPRDVVEKMRISQVKEAADFLGNFIAGGPETTGT